MKYIKKMVKKLIKASINSRSILSFYWSRPSQQHNPPYSGFMEEYTDSDKLRSFGSYTHHLYSAVRHTQPSRIVELGVKAGVTMKYMLEAMRKNENQGQIIGIDLPIDNPDVGDPYDQILNDDFYRKYSEIWRLNTQDASTVSKYQNLYKDIDLLFIDADHSYKGAKRDYTLWSPLVRKGGYIFFDDLQQAGPMRVWKEANGKKYLFKCSNTKTIQLCGCVILE